MNQFDIELENTVLGAILLEPTLCGITAFQILNKDVFYKNENGLVYGAISDLNKENKKIDILTVANKLKSNGIVELEGNNVFYYVSFLTNAFKSTNQILEHCQILYQLYLLRKLFRLGMDVQSKASTQTTDCFDLISDIEKQLQGFMTFQTSNIKHISQIHKEVVAANYEVLHNNMPTGVYSGWKNLDHITGGWQNGNLIILAARPGMGKSAVALQLIKYPAMKMNTPVAMFSLEMNNHENGSRMFASEAKLNNTHINQKKLTHAELTKLQDECGGIISAPIYMDDTPRLTMQQIKSAFQRLYYELGVRLFVFDYLQLANSGSDNKNREREISEVSRGLKILAKEFNVPIIALAQLSRGPENRTDKRPILSDLRESGAIEQDADIVMFLFRPAEYGLFPNGYEYGGLTLQTENLLLIDIAKGRGLRTGEVPLKFYGEQMIVTNYDY